MEITNRKGYIRLIEVSLAAALVFGFLIFVQQTQSSLLRGSQSYDPIVLKTLGEDIIRSLDLRDSDRNFRSDLRDYLRFGTSCINNWPQLTQEITAALPENVGFSVFLVDSSGNSLYQGGVATGAQPTQREIVTINYIVAGDYGSYCNIWSPCNVKLSLWFKI
ncbi:TPA: hypothetical protein H1005_00530 [archaeon]|uniref:Uncharacterized protein n=1 Tax=Candidatus Naiadarchaeum limnaeum TaxID=2756139 RepID=A0A832UQY9_9ARCH|nr:hypothetical protein [Candidatus Naiadarchaeales archaeon SRR2090153.bin1042]HIK00062.1 hypothetical protein [Candidatus Naiadarchaeum limnaeum]